MKSKQANAHTIQCKAWEVKVKTHDLNHDLTCFAHTIKCVCHSMRSMFRVLGIYNFAIALNCLELLQHIGCFCVRKITKEYNLKVGVVNEETHMPNEKIN